MQRKQHYRPIDAKNRITVPADYVGAEDGYQILETTENGQRRLVLVPVQD